MKMIYLWLSFVFSSFSPLSETFRIVKFRPYRFLSAVEIICTLIENIASLVHLKFSKWSIFRVKRGHWKKYFFKNCGPWVWTTNSCWTLKNHFDWILREYSVKDNVFLNSYENLERPLTYRLVTLENPKLNSYEKKRRIFLSKSSKSGLKSRAKIAITAILTQFLLYLRIYVFVINHIAATNWTFFRFWIFWRRNNFLNYPTC